MRIGQLIEILERVRFVQGDVEFKIVDDDSDYLVDLKELGLTEMGEVAVKGRVDHRGKQMSLGTIVKTLWMWDEEGQPMAAPDPAPVLSVVVQCRVTMDDKDIAYSDDVVIHAETRRMWVEEFGPEKGEWVLTGSEQITITVPLLGIGTA